MQCNSFYLSRCVFILQYCTSHYNSNAHHLSLSLFPYSKTHINPILIIFIIIIDSVEDVAAPVVAAVGVDVAAANGATASIDKPPSPSVPTGSVSRRSTLASSPRAHRRYRTSLTTPCRRASRTCYGVASWISTMINMIRFRHVPPHHSNVSRQKNSIR